MELDEITEVIDIKVLVLTLAFSALCVGLIWFSPMWVDMPFKIKLGISIFAPIVIYVILYLSSNK